MGTYTGTVSNDTITPNSLSAGVSAFPSGTRPSDAPDTIDGLDGGDTIDGGGGNDTIIDASPLRGGFHGPNAGNVIAGNRGNDTIAIKVLDTGGGNPAGNTANGGAGDDTVGLEIADFDNVLADLWVGQAPTGSVSLSGGGGNDVLEVLSFAVPTGGMTTALYGNDGADTLRATAVMYDPDGSRTGGNNTDRLYGGVGNDTYLVEEAQDLVIEATGQGTDTVLADDMDYVLPANVENLTMSYYYYPSENVYTGTGNGLNNVIAAAEDAYAPNYVFAGLAGNDTLVGGVGNDRLTGGAGLDRLMGGAGNDVFDYNAVTDSRAGATLRDVITTAFDGVGAAAGDKIDLATIDANTGAAGNQAFVFKGTGAITGAGQIRVAASGTDTLVQANTGGTLAADLEILVKDGTALPGQWAAGDFVL